MHPIAASASTTAVDDRRFGETWLAFIQFGWWQVPLPMPMLAAIVMVCGQIDRSRWIATLLSS